MAYEDPNLGSARGESTKFTQPKEGKVDEKKEEVKVEIREPKKEPEENENEEPESEEGLNPGNIEMVMSHTKCSRNKAIRTLRENNDDMVNAILKLSA